MRALIHSILLLLSTECASLFEIVTNAVAIEGLLIAQLQAAQKDPSQVLKAASAVKMLSLAAAGPERLHDLKWKALGLDRESVLQDELPELIIRDLTAKEIEEIKASHGGDPDEFDNDVVPETTSDEDNEIVVEDGESEDEHLESEAASRPTDAEGFRLVRSVA